MLAVSSRRTSPSAKLVGIALRFIAVALLSACVLETAPDESLPGAIISFELLMADNPGLPADIDGNVGRNLIALTVPADSDLTSLTPTIRFSGAEVSPPSGQAQDFTGPVTYTVSTPANRLRTYTVSVSKSASSSKDIRSFLIGDSEGVITGSDIAVTVPFGTDVTKLRASVIHSGASVEPDSGAQQNFSEPATYTVTALDGSTRAYRVIVSVAASDANEITAFSIGETAGEINGAQITLSLPFGTNPRSLEPTISYSGVSVSPANHAAQDFSGPVEYTVTAADGSTRVYTVIVTVTPNDAKDITRFSVAGHLGAISGSEISVTLPFGTSITALRPTVQFTGTSVEPASGAEQDFSEPVNYTVTAADGSTHVYTVTLTLAANTAKQITGFRIMGNDAVIQGTSITITLPFGTPVTSLAPTITFTGVEVEPASGVAQNFSSFVRYVVTAADGSTRAYSVAVTIAANDANEITAFSLGSAVGMFSGNSINVTVPFGSDVSSIAPTLTHTGVTIDPPEGQARDFRSPQTYQVTAQNGMVRTYTVNVTESPSGAKAITMFQVADRTGTITGMNIEVIVPAGTNRNGITPMVLMHTGMSIAPAANAPQDFRVPVDYVVTAADSTTARYTVTVRVGSASKDINTFTIGSTPGVVGANAVTVTLPRGTTIGSFSPVITLSSGLATVSPASGISQSFAGGPVTYTVTAEDGTTKDYSVTVAAARNTTHEITSFTINGVAGSIDGNNISVTLLAGTSPLALEPVIVHDGASVTPANMAPTNFTNPVSYRVTAEDTTTRDYTVTVTIPAAADSKNILTFNIMDAVPVIDHDANTIAITLPTGTAVTALAPTITHNGVSVSPASGASRNFTAPVDYTVTAQDGSLHTYAVTVTVPP